MLCLLFLFFAHQLRYEIQSLNFHKNTYSPMQFFSMIHFTKILGVLYPTMQINLTLLFSISFLKNHPSISSSRITFMNTFTSNIALTLHQLFDFSLNPSIKKNIFLMLSIRKKIPFTSADPHSQVLMNPPSNLSWYFPKSKSLGQLFIYCCPNSRISSSSSSKVTLL